MLEFQSIEDARKAASSEQMKGVIQGLRAVGAFAKVQILERSPFTPEPLRREVVA
jgi:hypothetical protein